jgi:hypothetical protein
VELADGFHTAYGFSPGDLMADILGVAYPLAQATFPVLENVWLKWSYWPSRDPRQALERGEARTFIDDYEGQKFWLSIDPHFAFTEGMRGLIPSWLGVALGYGVEGAIRGEGNGREVFYIALDYNFRRLAGGEGFIPSLLHALDFIHFPAPGIVIRGKEIHAGIVF